jgi:hypothetical protein
MKSFIDPATSTSRTESITECTSDKTVTVMSDMCTPAALSISHAKPQPIHALLSGTETAAFFRKVPQVLADQAMDSLAPFDQLPLHNKRILITGIQLRGTPLAPATFAPERVVTKLVS